MQASDLQKQQDHCVLSGQASDLRFFPFVDHLDISVLVASLSPRPWECTYFRYAEVLKAPPLWTVTGV